MAARIRKLDVILQILSNPAQAGYNDNLLLLNEHHIVYACPASGGPNHRQPMKSGAGPWQEKYGRIASGVYEYECVEHYNYGLCLLLNSGEAVPSRVPNPNHNGAMILTEEFLHSGETVEWRGSAGCPVVHPWFWKGCQYFFRKGMRGEFAVLDY